MTKRTKAILSLSGVFLLGALCGALVLGIIVRDRVQQAERLRDPEGFENYIVERLKLTEAQRDSIKDELNRTYAELAGLRHSTADEYRELLDTLKQRISPQLTPSQRELLAEMDLRFRRSFPKGRRPPPPHPGLISPPARKREPAALQTTPGDSVRPSSKKERAQEKSVKPSEIDSALTIAPDETDAGDEAETPALGQRFAEQLRQRLVLTDEQYKAVASIIRQTQERIRRARAELSDDRRMRRMALKRNMREMNQRIIAELTVEQREEYRKLMEELVRSRRR